MAYVMLVDVKIAALIVNVAEIQGLTLERIPKVQRTISSSSGYAFAGLTNEI